MGEGMEKGGGGGIELPRELANVVMPSMRQGLIIINDSREAEGIVQFFTAMIVDKDPLRVTDWRSEYITVNNKEFQEELKLLAMPLIHEMSVMRAIELPDGREYPVIMRKIHILLLAPPVGFVIFGQPSTALLVKDGDRLYLGFKGPSPETGDKIVVTIKSKVNDHVAIPFTPAIARFIFLGDVVETIIDDGGQARGLRK
jgi:hypothetical protein